ncbi:MAG: hypothetical protein J5722_09515, partial [Oscillospiraceae bacterium]|nr:hypothetical protein [Oscillospiraceae bacterium]
LYAVLNALVSASAFPGSFPGSTVLYVRSSDSLSVSDAAQIAEKSGVVLYTYTVQTVMKPDHPLEYQKTVVTFYTAKSDREAVWKHHLGLHPGMIRIAEGDLSELHDAVPEILDQNPELKRLVSCICLTGEPDACSRCAREIRSAYPAAFSETSSVSWNFDYLLPGFLLGFLLVLLLFWCYLDSAFEKKEIAIRVLHGDAPVQHYIRICLTDTIVFSGLFLLCISAQNLYTQISRPFRLMYLLFLPFLFGIWLVNLHLLNIRPKEMLYGHQLSKGILHAFSALGITAALFSCLVILGAFGMMTKVQKYDAAKAFIQSKKDYTYVNFKEPDELMQLLQSNQIEAYRTAENRLMQDERRFLKETDSVLQPILMADLTYEMQNYGMSTIWDMMYCNHRALPYLQTVFPEAAAIDLEHYDAAIMLPDTFPELEQHKAVAVLTEQFSVYEGYRPDTDRIQICLYHPGASAVSFDFSYNYFGYHDLTAICIASDTYRRQDIDKLTVNHYFLTSSCIFQIPEDLDIADISKEYSFKPIFRSVYDKFYAEYRKRQAYLLTSLLIAVLMLVFYISEIYTVLKLDYQVNATELAIRKTLGESMLQKNRRHFVGAAAVGFVNLVLAVCLSHFAHLLPMAAAVAVPAVLFVLNILLICFMIRRVEKQKLTKILKGGAL